MLALCPSIHVIFNPGSCVVSKLSQPSMKACLDVTNCKVYSRSLLHYRATISEITYVSFCQRVLSEQSILRSEHFLCSPFRWKPSPRRPRTGSWAQDQPPYKVFEVLGFCTIYGRTKDKSDYVGETGSVDTQQNRASGLIHGYHRSVDNTAQLIWSQTPSRWGDNYCLNREPESWTVVSGGVRLDHCTTDVQHLSHYWTFYYDLTI